MEIKVGDILQSYKNGNVACIVVNNGPSWRGAHRGCLVSLDVLPDGSYRIDSIIEEQGLIPKSTDELLYELLSRKPS